MLLRWYPRPDLKGSVWEAVDSGCLLSVYREWVIPDVCVFTATINGREIGRYGSPCIAMLTIDKMYKAWQENGY